LLQMSASPPDEMFDLEQLLEDQPLHSPLLIDYLYSNPANGWLAFPVDIRVHCENPKCDGIRRHHRESASSDFRVHGCVYGFVEYQCTDCTEFTKLFAVSAEWAGTKCVSGECTKIYQEPALGSSIPKRLFRVIGEENREMFLQARRAIARGLGVGAYAYYRRIVEIRNSR
jgi:hypothetical protein